MPDGTCMTPDCGNPQKARGLCNTCYLRRRAAGELPLLPPRPDHHRLTDLDREAATAICSICGPTKVRVKARGGSQCWTRVRESNSRRVAPRKDYPRSVETRRRSTLQAKYGMTLAEYEVMHESQANACAICRMVADDLQVDHDHQTGAVRGLLCPQCNKGIGFLRDDVTTLRRAIEYLITPPESPVRRVAS